MADLRERIINKYSVDISKENILKLYKIDNPDISEEDLLRAFQKTRKRWEQSANGANERIAERDRKRLELADKYEALLRNQKIRKELYRFYNSGADTDGASGNVGFARDYFQLIETTKKLKKKDVDFFFAYYQEERKNKKAIIEMLSKEFRIAGIGKMAKREDADDTDVDKIEEKRKTKNGPMIINLFQEAMILHLRKALNQYETVKSNETIRRSLSSLPDSLYAFLQMDSIDSLNLLRERIEASAKNAYAVRQDKGADYIPLVDLFNTLQTLTEFQDVRDNFKEFKLLLKYPSLTPYMFAFLDVKPKSLKGLFRVAEGQYVFQDEVDFILNYFLPLYANFGISKNEIRSVIKAAKKKAKANKIIGVIDSKFGHFEKRKLSLGARILHGLAYYPIFAIYVILIALKTIFELLSNKFMAGIVALIGFGVEELIFPDFFGMDSFVEMAAKLPDIQVTQTLASFGISTPENGLETMLIAVLTIWLYLMLYVPPLLILCTFTVSASKDFNKHFDWIGYKRMYKRMLDELLDRAEEAFLADRKTFYRDMSKKAIVNALCTVVIVVAICFVRGACL